MSVEAAEIGKDDVLVFSTDSILDSDGFRIFRNNLKGNLEKAGIPDQKFIALDGSTTLQVLKPHKTGGVLDGITYAQAAEIRSFIDRQVRERLLNGMSMQVSLSPEDEWARSAVNRQPEQPDWVGLSYEMASRKAQAICLEAGRTGVTRHVASYLSKFHNVMNVLRDRSA